MALSLFLSQRRPSIAFCFLSSLLLFSYDKILIRDSVYIKFSLDSIFKTPDRFVIRRTGPNNMRGVENTPTCLSTSCSPLMFIVQVVSYFITHKNVHICNWSVQSVSDYYCRWLAHRRSSRCVINGTAFGFDPAKCLSMRNANPLCNRQISIIYSTNVIIL